MKTKRKPGSGGSRPGSGRKPSGIPTKTISIRHSVKVIDGVKKKFTKRNFGIAGREWLESLIEPD